MELVLLFIGAVIGGLISWVITHKYHVRASLEQKEALVKLSNDLKESNTLKYFEYLLDNSEWKKEFINNEEVWLAEKNKTFQIIVGDKGRRFIEKWSEDFPDSNTECYPVYLKINTTIIKEIEFISIDGHRIFVPMPDRRVCENKISYFWKMESLEMKLCNIIGSYYIYENIYNVAKRTKVKII